MKSFYVYLPSNVRNPFRENTTSNYITNLSSVLRLSDNWEVGLAEICFKKCWFNIKRDYKIGLTAENGQSFFYSEAVLTKGSYDSIESILQLLNNQFDLLCKFSGIAQLLQQEISRSPEIIYDKLSRKTQTIIGKTDINWAIFPHLDSELFEILGFTSYNDEKYKYQREKHEKPILVDIVEDDLIKGVTDSKSIANIEGAVNSLYIYCDAIKPSYVGDTLSKLIRVVQVPRCHFGEPIQKIYDIPHYFPISSNEINEIEIDIKVDTGEAIEFNQ